MNWNTPLINGFPGQPFISKESFKLYSISPDHELMDLDWLPDSDVDQPTVEPVKEAMKEKSHVKNDKVIKQKRLLQPFSALTSDQHKKYLELCLKYHFNKPTNHDEQKELSILKELQGIVAAEQREFMTYLRNLAELNAENYLQMFSPAENFINNYIANLKERVRGYPQYYVSYNAVNFAPTPDSQITNIFFRKNLLLEMGQVSRALLPTLEKSKCFLPRNSNRIKKANNGPYKEVSQDGNIDKLAELIEADVAMSYSALECLFDNHAPHFDRQWELPLTVKRDPKGRKLVIIDDPFVAKEMTIPEKNQMFHHILMKSFLIHPNHKNYFDLDSRRENLGNLKDRIWDETEEPDEDVDKRRLEEDFESLFEGNHLTDLERGVVSDIPSTSEEVSRLVDREEDSSDAENLVIDAPSSRPPSPIVSYDGQNDEKPAQKSSNISNQAILQAPAKKLKIDPQAAQCTQRAKSNLLDAILEQQSMMLSAAPNGPGREAPANLRNPGQHLSLQFNNQPVVSYDGYERPAERNVSYSLWMMGKLNVILKDHYHGYIKIKKFGSCFIELFTKMEYQKSHGFEQLSESELSRMWLALQMKPSIKNILLGRVDAFTSEFLKHEKVMRENLNWNFSKCLQQLEVVLKACGELDFGSFLISHTQGSKNFQIKKTTNNQNGFSGAYNLYLAYEQAEVKLSAHKTFERHWLPIDLNVPGKFTPVSRIPCTFEPRDTKRSNNTKSKKKT